MHIEGEAKLLRIFVGESDRLGSTPLYEKIVLEARSAGLAGATVTKGTMGYGASSRLHTAKILRLSEDLPVVIEIADTEEKINLFLNRVNTLFDEAGCGGLVTVEKVQVIKYT